MYENAQRACRNCLSSLFCSCCSGSPFQLPRYPYIFHLIYFDLSIERRSRYVTLSWQQNFCLTRNRKLHLKSEFALLQTSSILFNFIKFGKCWRHFLRLNPKGPYLSLEKEKDNICVVFTHSIKRACEIRKFHVPRVQPRQRSEQNGMMHVVLSIKSYYFFVVGFVVIQKQCYHGDVTSHFSSLLITSFQPRPQGLLVFQYWRTRRPWGRG